MPVLQPAELWRKSGRYDIDEVFKLEDRRGAELVLAMTHEENLTFHVAREIRSYRDLPKILYHFQTKERDEPRPRAGVLRTREFIMKDSYTFDRDAEGLDHGYELHVQAYDRIFDRTGLEWYRVESDVGMMGGLGAHEYMAPCAAGENDVALSDAGYAANVEVASAEPQPVEGLPEPLDAPEPVETPGATTIEQVAGLLDVPAGALIKAMPVMVEGRGPVLVVLRGDHRLNEIKLQNTLGAPVRQANESELRDAFGAVAGFIGPVRRARGGGGRRGPARHARPRGRRERARPAPARGRAGPRLRAHLGRRAHGRARGHAARTAARSASSPPSRSATSSSSARATPSRSAPPTSTRTAASSHIWMGSYGIGPARIAAAAIEQFADEQGISWPRELAPFDVELVTLGKEGEEARDGLGEPLRRAAGGRARGPLRRPGGERGGEVRRRRAAGLPAAPDRGAAQPGDRRDRGAGPARPGAALPAARGRRRGGRGAVARAPLTRRRLLGLDRSGGPPPETRRKQPLHPWTLPNAIGFIRIALIPVFLVLALDSGDGRDTTATIIFAVIAWSDYLDGMVARITGQYSRLGALLDPLTDRLLVIAGAIVAWEFELLPRWALVVLAARELFMLVLTQVALRTGMDLKVNMLGRWAVWPVMGALGVAFIWETWVSDVMLYVGLAMTLAATALYVQDGLRHLRGEDSAPSSST